METVIDQNLEYDNCNIYADKESLYSDDLFFSSTSKQADLSKDLTTTSTSSFGLSDEALLYNELNNLQHRIDQLRDENERITEENKILRANVTLKDKQIFVLKTNISSLYKTAKAELDRRSQELADLRREYDSLIFRRISQNHLSNVDTNAKIETESNKSLDVTCQQANKAQSNKLDGRQAHDKQNHQKKSSFITPENGCLKQARKRERSESPFKRHASSTSKDHRDSFKCEKRRRNSSERSRSPFDKNQTKSGESISSSAIATHRNSSYQQRGDYSGSNKIQTSDHYRDRSYRQGHKVSSYCRDRR